MNPSNKINVMFLLPNFDSGGSEKLVIDIIKNINKEIFLPVLTVFFTGTYEKEFCGLGYPFYIIHKDKIRSKISTLFFLKKIVKEHNIHIVNTHHSSSLIQGVFPFKFFGNTILIHTEHSNLDNDRNITPKIFFLEKLFLKKADIALGISQGVCDYFKLKFKVPENKIRKIINGVDITRFQISKDVSREYRKQLGIHDKKIVIGLFGNLRVEKNHKLLVNAVHLLDKSIKDNLKVLLCGSGPMLEELKKQVAELNLNEIVEFLGVRKDIPELMSVLDVYTLVSIYEGMPLSILEAIAAGKPIVATNVLGINEVIKDGENGLLAESNNPESLANALTRMINDKELRIKIANNNLNERMKYSFSEMIKNYENLFKELYDKKN